MIPEKKYIIGVVGENLFPGRMHLDFDLARILYKQLIAVLELIGVETQKGICDIRLGVYLDSNNEGTRKFILGEKESELIENHFSRQFIGVLLEYGKRERRKGSEILFQLNNGEVTMDQFNDKLK